MLQSILLWLSDFWNALLFRVPLASDGFSRDAADFPDGPVAQWPDAPEFGRHDVNPATGYPIVDGGVDAGGNPIGSRGSDY